MTSSPEAGVHDNSQRHRYELEVNGLMAQIQYRLHGNTITFIHTEVPNELEGRGVASHMAQVALDDARARGLKVVAQCPFVASYIRRHPEYQDLLAESG